MAFYLSGYNTLAEAYIRARTWDADADPTLEGEEPPPPAAAQPIAAAGTNASNKGPGAETVQRQEG